MNAKPVAGTPAEFVAEYFTLNGPIEPLIDFRRNLAAARDAQQFADNYARIEAHTDQVFPRVWFTTNAAELAAYIDAELAE